MKYDTIHSLLEKNDLILLRELISNGFNVNHMDWGRLVLNTACFYMNYESVYLLIESGANVNLRNGMGHDPIYISCLKNKSIEICKLLMDAGSILDRSYNGERDSLLHIACRHSTIETTELLVSNGLDVNKRNGLGKKPIQIALDYGKDEMVNMLYRNGTDLSGMGESEINAINVIVSNHNWLRRRIIMMERFSPCMDYTSLIKKTIHGSFDIFKEIISYI